MLIGAGADTIIQKATTGEVNWGQVAVSGAFGLVGGGLGAAVGKHLVGNAVEGAVETWRNGRQRSAAHAGQAPGFRCRGCRDVGRDRRHDVEGAPAVGGEQARRRSTCPTSRCHLPARGWARRSEALRRSGQGLGALRGTSTRTRSGESGCDLRVTSDRPRYAWSASTDSRSTTFDASAVRPTRAILMGCSRTNDTRCARRATKQQEGIRIECFEGRPGGQGERRLQCED